MTYIGKIIQSRAESNEIDIRKTIQEINGTKSWFFGKIKHFVNLYSASKIKQKNHRFVTEEMNEVLSLVRSWAKRIIKQYLEQF